MSYTVGIKRRILPGYRRVSVTAHSWEQGRFILNLSDGSQEHVVAAGLKVYPDFWTHLAQIERSNRAVHIERSGIVTERPVTRSVPRETQPEPPTAFEAESYEPVESVDMQEVKRRAAERVRSILAADAAH